MPISFVGSTRQEVESSASDFLNSFEHNGTYDYILDVRQSRKGGNWKGTLILFFHTQ